LPTNLARFLFLDPRATDFFVDWSVVADDAVAVLRAEAGANPLDHTLSDLVGELATRSDDFRTRWARHNVRRHRTAVKVLRNPSVGELQLTGNALELPSEGQTLIAYTADPGSDAQQQLDFLSSWSTSHRVAAPTDGHGDLRITSEGAAP